MTMINASSPYLPCTSPPPTPNRLYQLFYGLCCRDTNKQQTQLSITCLCSRAFNQLIDINTSVYQPHKLPFSVHQNIFGIDKLGE